MICPNTNCNKTLADDVDYCDFCGFAISDKAKREQLEQEIVSIKAGKFKLIVENQKKEDKIKKLEVLIGSLDSLPTKTFEEFNKKKSEKHNYTPLPDKPPQKLKRKILWGAAIFILAIILIIIIGIYVYIHDDKRHDDRPIIPIIIGISVFVSALLFLVLFFMAKRIIRCFFKSGFYAKTIEFALALFTVIAFLFSLYASILSEHYGKTNSAYYWFNPQHVFEFPIKQLQYYDETQTININELPKNDSVNYVFVVDKTLSNQETDANWTTFVKNSIKNTNRELIKDIDTLNKHSDILLAGMLPYLDSSATHNKYSIMLYNGLLKNEDTSPIEAMFIKDRTDVMDILQSYVDTVKFIQSEEFIEKYRPKSRQTNFQRIFDSLNNNNLLKSNYRNVVFFFSDFYHETRNWNMLDKKINKFFRKDTNLVVKLFELDILTNEPVLNNKIRPTTIKIGDENYQDIHRQDIANLELDKKVNYIIDYQKSKADRIESKIDRVEELLKFFSEQYGNTENESARRLNTRDCIEKTKQLIKTNGKYVTIYEYEQGEKFQELYASGGGEQTLKLFLSAYAQVPQKAPVDTLVLYYPVSFGKYNSTNKATIKFDIGNTNRREYIFNLKNEGFSNEIDMQLTSDSNVIILKEYQLSLDTIYTVKYSCNIRTQNISNDFYLEVSDTSGQGKILIQFKELVPKFVCIVLILLYTLEIFLFFSCIAIFLIKLYHCIVKRYGISDKTKLRNVFLGMYVFPSILLLIFISVYCAIQVANTTGLIIWWSIFSIGILLLLAIFIYNENHYIKHQCEECLKKLATEKYYKDTEKDI
jgi:hypothetical protein